MRKQLMIGSDPEIGFTNDHGDQIRATDLFDYHREGSLLGNIDFDGHKDIMEIKTGKGDSCPKLHTARLKNLLISFARRLDYFKRIKEGNGFRVVAGSMVNNDPMGGHFHFQIKGNSGLAFASSLDLFLAVPIMMLATKKSFVIRPKNQDNYGTYGKLSDIRAGKTHGGWEYRTTPSWILSENLSKSLLCLSYVVTYEIYAGDKTVSKFSDLPTNAEKAYYTADKKYFFPLMDKIFTEIKEMQLYPIYALEIASLFGLIKAFNTANNKKHWLETKCIFGRWGITEDLLKGQHSITYDKTNEKFLELFKNYEGKKFDRPIKFYRLPKYVSSPFVVHPQVPSGLYMWGIYTNADNFEMVIGIADKLVQDKESIRETREVINDMFKKCKIKTTYPESEVKKELNIKTSIMPEYTTDWSPVPIEDIPVAPRTSRIPSVTALNTTPITREGDM